MRDYVWQLEVEYPADAVRKHSVFGEVFNTDWAPPGWTASEEYESRFGTDKFVWPAVRRFYLSRSSAVERANLIESYGATVRLMRSQLLEFTERDYKRTGRKLRVIEGGAA